MRRIQEDFKSQDDKIAELDVYLGAPIAKMSLGNGETCWTMLPQQYVKAAVSNVQEDLAKYGKRLPSKCVIPFSCNYDPWLEETPELEAEGVQRFQKLMGQLPWAVEIGCVDILLETLLLSRYPAMPQARHLEQAFHIFGYLKTHPKRKIGFDPSKSAIGRSFTGTSARQSLRTNRNPGARACRRIVSLMQSMPGTRRQDDHKLVSFVLQQGTGYVV
jgi:hypothetical protein